jgi:hypothetical protein
MAIFRDVISRFISRSVCSLGLALAILSLAGTVRASVIYDSLTFNLTNNPTCNSGNNCGSAMTTNGGLSLVFTGENTGSGLPGVTDLLTTVPGNGTITFDWTYATLNAPDTETVGYLLQGVFFELANANGGSGVGQTVSVTAGESFGFEIQALDNQGEPGVLTVSNFSAPGSSVPEPGTLNLVIAGALVLALGALKLKTRPRPTTRGLQ